MHFLSLGLSTAEINCFILTKRFYHFRKCYALSKLTFLGDFFSLRITEMILVRSDKLFYLLCDSHFLRNYSIQCNSHLHFVY